MKPLRQDLIIVTATTNLDRARDCLRSWQARALFEVPMVIVVNGGETGCPAEIGSGGVTLEIYTDDYLGVVPAYARGVDLAMKTGADLIACFHDDLEILGQAWDQQVVDHFHAHPTCGLAGFGGGRGLGAEAIYQDPYDPMQLARQGFVSNMQDALAHGAKKTCPCRVACLDGFSQIGRRAYWRGDDPPPSPRSHQDPPYEARAEADDNLFSRLEHLGLVHHAYDAALGCYAARNGWDTWMIPVACHHYGGRTAVADQGYHAWARRHSVGGDHGFWEQAHRLVYEEFIDVLPLRLEDGNA